MRMPSDQFAIEVVQHIGYREMTFVRGHLRIKQHLQQQVA
jgi:hypothetical protein